MTRLNISSRLMATAALGALMLAAVPATAQEQAAPATETVAKPEIGAFGFDLSGMDKSVQPGDDFYAYANGTWAKNTEIPADKSDRKSVVSGKRVAVRVELGGRRIY